MKPFSREDSSRSRIAKQRDQEREAARKMKHQPVAFHVSEVTAFRLMSQQQRPENLRRW